MRKNIDHPLCEMVPENEPTDLGADWVSRRNRSSTCLTGQECANFQASNLGKQFVVKSHPMKI